MKTPNQWQRLEAHEGGVILLHPSGLWCFVDYEDRIFADAVLSALAGPCGLCVHGVVGRVHPLIAWDTVDGVDDMASVRVTFRPCRTWGPG